MRIGNPPRSANLGVFSGHVSSSWLASPRLAPSRSRPRARRLPRGCSHPYGSKPSSRLRPFQHTHALTMASVTGTIAESPLPSSGARTPSCGVIWAYRGVQCASIMLDDARPSRVKNRYWPFSSYVFDSLMFRFPGHFHGRQEWARSTSFLFLLACSLAELFVGGAGTITPRRCGCPTPIPRPRSRSPNQHFFAQLREPSFRRCPCSC